MSTDFRYFFVIFNIFTIMLLCFYAKCTTIFTNFENPSRLFRFACSILSSVPHVFCSICSTFSIFATFSTIATVLVTIFRLFAPFFQVFASCEFVFVPSLFHFSFQTPLIFLHKKRCPVLQSTSSVCFIFCFGNAFHMFPVCFFIRYFPLFGMSHPRSVPSPRSFFRRSCGSPCLRSAWRSPAHSGRRLSVPVSGSG